MSGALAALAATAACGARSELRVRADGGDIGAGGRGGGGQGGVDPTGPTGGNVGCDGLQVRTTRSFFTAPNHLARAPQLAATSEDGEQVTLVFRSDEDPPIIDGSGVLAQVTFLPWEEWTDAPLGDETVLFVGSTITVVPKQPAAGLSFLTRFDTFAARGVAVALGVDTATASPPTEPLVFANDTTKPQFLAQRSGANVWGYGVIDSTSSEQSAVGFLQPGVATFVPASCGTSLTIDGIASDGAFLAATWDGCTSRTPVLELLHFAESGVSDTTIVDVVNTEVVQLHLLPRDDGDVWLLFRTTGDALMAQHIAFDGTPRDVARVVLDAQTATSTSLQLGMAAVGDAFALAYPTAAQTMTLALFDDAGALVSTDELEWPAQASVSERVSLLASPNRDAILLAWAADSHPDDIAGDARVLATLVSCVPVR